MITPVGFASSASFDDSADPARITTAASSTASGSRGFEYRRRAADIGEANGFFIVGSHIAGRQTSCHRARFRRSTSRTSLPSSVSPPTSAMISAKLGLRRLRFWAWHHAANDAAERMDNAAPNIDRQPKPAARPATRSRCRRSRRPSAPESAGSAGRSRFRLLEAPVTPGADHQERQQREQAPASNGPMKVVTDRLPKQ